MHPQHPFDTAALPYLVQEALRHVVVGEVVEHVVGGLRPRPSRLAPKHQVHPLVQVRRHVRRLQRLLLVQAVGSAGSCECNSGRAADNSTGSSSNKAAWEGSASTWYAGRAYIHWCFLNTQQGPPTCSLQRKSCASAAHGGSCTSPTGCPPERHPKSMPRLFSCMGGARQWERCRVGVQQASQTHMMCSIPQHGDLFKPNSVSPAPTRKEGSLE